MVMIGVIRSKFPIRQQSIQSNSVMQIARYGSAASLDLMKLKMGRISSLAIAARSAGAPVRDWRAAPRVESVMPTETTEGTGHATVAERYLREGVKRV